jgi:hypothetical protein
MMGLTCSSPNGFGASGRGDPPPPLPMTLAEAFMATQIKVLREILQAQQQMAQQLQQRPPHGANHDGLHIITTYT